MRGCTLPGRHIRTVAVAVAWLGCVSENGMDRRKPTTSARGRTPALTLPGPCRTAGPVPHPFVLIAGDSIYKRFSKDYKRQARTCGLTTLDLEQLKDEIKDEDKVFELIVTAYDLNFASSIASSDPGAARCRGRVQRQGAELGAARARGNAALPGATGPARFRGSLRLAHYGQACGRQVTDRPPWLPSFPSTLPLRGPIHNAENERWPLPLLNFEMLYERFIVNRNYVAPQYNPGHAIPGFPERGFTSLFEDSAYLASHLPMFITGYNTGRGVA